MIEALNPGCQPMSFWQRQARKLILQRTRNLSGETIEVIDRDGRWEVGDQSKPLDPVRVLVRNPRFYQKLAWGGGLGAAESWMDGDWTCSDLPRLLRALIRNMDVVDSYERGWARFRQPWERFWHWLNRNTLKRSRSNIREHYDLGNQLFALFLDPTMNYSSALFEQLGFQEPPESLHRAQLRKMHRLCETLQLSPRDHLLEIGTGWGSLACYAARHFGCRVTTTTISHEQYQWACERVCHEGLQERVTVLEQDYRLLEGKFDKIISVEMIEAVGDQFYETFFAKCSRILKDDGLLLLQAITIVDQRYPVHLQSVDFICKYIFPGGSLPCVSRLVTAAAQAAEMRPLLLQDFAAHYAETLRRWRSRFWHHLDDVRALGYSERFVRMWDYYLAYCEAAFEERQINLAHLLFSQRGFRGDLVSHPGFQTQDLTAENRQEPCELNTRADACAASNKGWTT